jgi:acyl carrier protein
MNDNYLAILRRHLRYLAPEATLDTQAPLRSMGLDSMAAVALMLDLEDEFGVTLPDSSLTAEVFSTADRLWMALRRAGAAGESRPAPASSGHC